MANNGKITVGLVWAQFAAYHVDRCEAVARRLGKEADLLCVEVATTSKTYAWEPSGAIAGARKVTLFNGHAYEQVAWPRRTWAMLRALWHCDWVMIGLSYADPAAIALSWLLRLRGARIVAFSESKADDRPRRALAERAKRLALSCYQAAIVGGPRHVAYFRSLGFGRRPVLEGYDGVSIARVRAMAGGVLAPDGADFALRPFVFVGRFVDKKNLPVLLDAYARYLSLAGEGPRRLVLAGTGEEEAQLRARAARLGIADMVDLPGFLPADEVARLLSGALALVLVSREEQWGLVVNEAMALGLPVIVSREVGARDTLVEDGVNGLVVDSASTEAIAAAMGALAGDRPGWARMVEAAHARAHLGDAERLAEAVERLVCGESPELAGAP